MKARIVLFSTILALFLVAPLAFAQKYYLPNYTQSELPGRYKAPVFVENRTGGQLKVEFDVDGVIYFLNIDEGKVVTDLMVPVGVLMKVKEARAVVFDGNKTKSKKVKYTAYRRETGYPTFYGYSYQGWRFYRDDIYRP